MDASTDTEDPTSPLADITKIATTRPEPLPAGVSLQSGIDALSAVATAHKAELQATIEAAQKNNAVVLGLQTSTDTANNEAIDAYTNLNKIAHWPSSVSHLLGLFDSSMNATVQKNNLDISQLKLKSAAEKAQQQISINNSEPAIAKLRSELATQDFNFQKDAFQLAGTVKGLSQKDLELRLSATRLMLDMTTDQREKTNFALNSLTDAQKRQQLALAAKGKGDWVGKEGLLEHSINVEEQATTALAEAKQHFLEGNIALADKSTDDFLSKVPNYILAAKIEDARKTGAQFIDFDGHPVATNKVEAGFIKNKKTEDDTVAALTAESGQQISEKMTTIGTAATAMAGLDPEGARLSAMYGSALDQYNKGPKDYNAARQFSAFLDDMKTKQQAVAKRVASTASSPEAKAAIEGFATTGHFDAEGGQAVIKGITGNYMAQTRTKYSAAMAVYNNAVAAEVARQGLSGAPVFDGSKSAAAQTQQMMAYITSSKDQKKIGEIKDEVLANPTVNKQVADAMQGVVQVQSLKLVFNDLAMQPQAAKFWAELRDHPEQMYDAQGAFSPNKLAQFLAAKSVPLGPGAPDYGSVLAEAMKTRAVGSRANPTQDPTKTVYDHALEAQIFNGNPESSILADFAQRLQINAMAAQADMKKRIQQDLAVQNAGESALTNMETYGMEGIVVPPGGPSIPPEVIQSKLLTAPSATGSGLTRAQIQKLYGGPQPATAGPGR